jgi:hypothetical protein
MLQVERLARSFFNFFSDFNFVRVNYLMEVERDDYEMGLAIQVRRSLSTTPDFISEDP